MWRATVVSVVILLSACTQSQVLDAPPVRPLRVVPGVVFKVPDPGRGRTESWVCNVVIPKGGESVEARKLVIELFSKGNPVASEVHGAESVAAMRRRSYLLLPEVPRPSPTALLTLEEEFDLRIVQSRPAALGADLMRVTVQLGAGAVTWNETVDVPLTTYVQKTELVFPLRSPAIVTQGPFNDRGHSGHANQFAIDVIGLDANYAPQTTSEDTNEAYAGWKSEVIAPAAGVIVYMRTDVPNNPAPGDPKMDLIASLPEADLAIAGNCVIIDHGNGEFSVLMHLQPGFDRFKAGDPVRQGDVVGYLGSSGDSFGPHLHYQLQTGPALFRDSSVPVRFANLPGATLSRGTYLTPRRN